MKAKKILTGILAAALALGFLGCGTAEWREEKKNNKVSRKYWVDESGKAALCPQGYAQVAFTYNGTTVTEHYLDTEGKPAETLGGYCGRILKYGNKHRLEEIIYLDDKDFKAECASGYARVKIGHTAAGGVTQTLYYDAENQLVMVPSLGYAMVKNDYRGTTLTKTTYLDEHKNPVDTPLGYAVMIQNVNKSNRVLGIHFEHADGTPATGEEGWASMKREVDKKNREISVKYYDLNGQMIDRGLGYAYETRSWESNQICTVRRFDLNNKQIPMGEGHMALLEEMNKDGQVIRETFLDEKGGPKENAEGIAVRKYEYDGEGQLISVRFEGARGDATENSAGYAGYRETLDAEGFVASRTFLGKGGNPKDIAAGYSEIRYLYDENHQLMKTEYYNTSGSLIKAE